MRSLRSRILTVAVTGVLFVTFAGAGMMLLRKSEVSRGIAQEIDAQARASIAAIAGDITAMVRVQHENTLQALSAGLNVARSVLAQRGKMGLSEREVTWPAVNQLDKSEKQVSLPAMMLGTETVQLNRDMKVRSPVVDEVRDLVGASCTLFQRIDSQGDMLRVATNVPQSDGTRAVGTYIPAISPDGTANPVISAILQGKPYKGRAFVVDAWYLSVYEPIVDERKNIIGMLFVGVKQEGLTTSLRDSILAARVGDTGYAFVLGGKGASQGRYIVSKDGKRDGENIWEAKDSDGKPFIQSMIRKALALKPGETAFERYPWQNKGESAPRMKISAVQYFEPWDWVIGVGVYEDELGRAKTQLDGVITNLQFWVVLTGLVALVLSAIAAYAMASRIAASLNRVIESLKQSSDQLSGAAAQVSEASQSLAEGVSEQASSLEETSASLEQISSLTHQNADNAHETEKVADDVRGICERSSSAILVLADAVARIQRSADQTSKIVRTIDQIAFQTNLLALNAAVEAARAGEAGKGFAVVADEVRRLAQRSAEAARNTSALIDESLKSADSGVQAAEQVGDVLGQILDRVQTLHRLIGQVSAASKEQAQGLDQINSATAQMDKVTQSNASSAEETAAASEQLSAQARAIAEMVGALIGIVRGAAGSMAGASGLRKPVAAKAEERPASPALSGSEPALLYGNGADGHGTLAAPARLAQDRERNRGQDRALLLEDRDLKDF